jgi:thiol:disulfide interchange protein DsbC
VGKKLCELSIKLTYKQQGGYRMDNFAMSFLKKTSAVLLILMFATACAELPHESEVKALLEQNMGEGAKVDVVTKTPYSGLYEVQASGNIFYTDGKGEHIFLGEIIETKNGRHITRERFEELSKITFSDLPFDSAVKKVKGDGSRVIAVFSDPNCGYCKRLEENLKTVDNVTIYTFVYAMLSSDSAKKAKNIWCAKDKNKAWDNWMLNGKAPGTASEKCEDPTQKVVDLGRKLKVNGTPMIYFSDGTRISGAIDAVKFEEKFARIK